MLIETRAGSKGIRSSSKDGSDRFYQASPQDRREVDQKQRHRAVQKSKAEALRKVESTQQSSASSRYCGGSEEAAELVGRQARQDRTYQTLQREAKGLEIELLSVTIAPCMPPHWEAVDRSPRSGNAGGGAGGEQARLDSEQEAIPASDERYGEAITRAGYSRRHRTAAITGLDGGVERNRTEFPSGNGSGCAGNGTVGGGSGAGAGEGEELRATLLQLEGTSSSRRRSSSRPTAR